jgi:chemotaxis response regulator CheB
MAFGPGRTRLGHIIPEPIDVEAVLTDQAQDRGSQRVLVVENQLLLGAGLQSLLADKADLDVIGISPGDGEELVREIRRIQPDVILLNADSHLADPVELLALLSHDPGLRVLAFNANNHLVRIHTKQGALEVLVERTPQLVHLICDR